MRLTKLPLFFGFVLTLLISINLFGQSHDNISHLTDQCESCHVAGKDVSAENAERLFANQEELCATCHNDNIQISHPSGIRGTHDSDEFPLDWKGDVTCSTCHNIHFNNDVKSLRSDKTGKEFCLSCHDEAFFLKMADKGDAIFEDGHLGGNSENVDGIDSFSIECIRCHNSEVNVPNVLVDENNVVRHQSGRANHPIGTSYVEAFRFGGYKPIWRLSKRILLPNGNISCISCHVAYKRNHGEVLLEDGKICLNCHDK